MNRNRNLAKKIYKDEIIETAAEIANKDVKTMKDCYDAVEKVIKDYISSTDCDNQFHIKLCEGISLDCKYVQEKQKKNNLTGETINVAGHIKPKFNFTRNFLQSINS